MSGCCVGRIVLKTFSFFTETHFFTKVRKSRICNFFIKVLICSEYIFSMFFFTVFIFRTKQICDTCDMFNLLVKRLLSVMYFCKTNIF